MKEFEIELAANPDEYFANFYLGILYIIDRKWDGDRPREKAVSKQPNNRILIFHRARRIRVQNTSRRSMSFRKAFSSRRRWPITITR